MVRIRKNEKTETVRLDDRRLMIDQFLTDSHYSKRAKKQLAQNYGGDLANVPLKEIPMLAAWPEIHKWLALRPDSFENHGRQYESTRFYLV